MAPLFAYYSKGFRMKDQYQHDFFRELIEMIKLKTAPTFRGGIHPYDGKELTQDIPVVDYMDPKEEMVFPMVQHMGGPCKPVVAKGDRVLRDQIIGEPIGLGAQIFSSVSGTVVDIRPMLHPSGNMVMSVIVQNDHQYEIAPKPYEPAGYKDLSREEILERIRYAGIVGMGGTGYPTYLKLNPGKKIDYVLINGSETEPFVTSDYRIMLEDSWRIVNGLKIVMSLFEGAEGLICIGSHNPKAIKVMDEYVKEESDISVVSLGSKYPLGSEKHLIYAATKREMIAGKLPSDAGCVVLNVDTAVAISRAITQGRPVQRCIVTVSGDCVASPKNYRVRIGTSIKELLAQTGDFIKTPALFVDGSTMRGRQLSSLDVPVIKTTSCILALSEEYVHSVEEGACIHCGRCAEVCPMRLVPTELDRFVSKGNSKAFASHHGMNCIECGSCQYICPANRKLTQSNRRGKQMISEQRNRRLAEAEAKRI